MIEGDEAAAFVNATRRETIDPETTMPWNPLDFPWPRLHAACQVFDDEAAVTAATEAWEKACAEYREYLASVEWPDWSPLLKGDTAVSFHDAEVVALVWSESKAVIVLNTKNCPDFATDKTLVVEYELTAAPVVISGTRGEAKEWLYDQFAALGDGVYRQYVMFDDLVVQFDFRNLKVAEYDT